MAWTAVLALSALCCAVACGLAWTRPRTALVRTLGAGTAGATLWCVGAAVLSAGPPVDVVVVSRLVTTSGALLVAVCAYWMARTLDDPHRRPTRTDLAVVLVPAALVMLSLASNPWHQLLYVDPTGPVASADRYRDGPLYLVLIAVMGVPATLAMVLLCLGLLRSPAHFRPHVRALLLSGTATSAGVVASLLASRPDRHVDVVPVALAVTAVVTVVGLARRDLLTVVPLARAQLVEDLPDAVLVTSPDGLVLDVNASCRALVSRLRGGDATPAAALVGRPLAEVLPVAVEVGGEVASPLPGLHLDVRTTEIRATSGTLLGRALLLRDVSDVVERRLAAERTSERLADEAARDPLTGLLNRRGMRATAERLPALVPLAVVILDVDHFKAVNDTHGHDVGDDVLQALAAALTEVAPPGAVVARLGGEELAVLLPGPLAARAAAVAEDLLGAVRACAVPLPGGSGGRLRVTSSAGVALGSAVDLTEVMRRADEALYAAKRTGRDRAVLDGAAPVPAASP